MTTNTTSKINPDDYIVTESDGIICPLCTHENRMPYQYNFGPDWVGETDIKCEGCGEDIRVVRSMRVIYTCYCKLSQSTLGDLKDKKFSESDIEASRNIQAEIDFELVTTDFIRNRHLYSYIKCSYLIESLIYYLVSNRAMNRSDAIRELNKRGLNLSSDSAALHNFVNKYYSQCGLVEPFISRNAARDFIRPLHLGLLEGLLATRASRFMDEEENNQLIAKLIITSADSWFASKKTSSSLNSQYISALALNKLANHIDIPAATLIQSSERLTKIYSFMLLGGTHE